MNDENKKTKSITVLVVVFLIFLFASVSVTGVIITAKFLVFDIGVAVYYFVASVVIFSVACCLVGVLEYYVWTGKPWQKYFEYLCGLGFSLFGVSLWVGLTGLFKISGFRDSEIKVFYVFVFHSLACCFISFFQIIYVKYRLRKSMRLHSALHSCFFITSFVFFLEVIVEVILWKVGAIFSVGLNPHLYSLGVLLHVPIVFACILFLCGRHFHLTLFFSFLNILFAGIFAIYVDCYGFSKEEELLYGEKANVSTMFFCVMAMAGLSLLACDTNKTGAKLRMLMFDIATAILIVFYMGFHIRFRREFSWFYPTLQVKYVSFQVLMVLLISITFYAPLLWKNSMLVMIVVSCVPFFFVDSGFCFLAPLATLVVIMGVFIVPIPQKVSSAREHTDDDDNDFNELVEIFEKSSDVLHTRKSGVQALVSGLLFQEHETSSDDCLTNVSEWWETRFTVVQKGVFIVCYVVMCCASVVQSYLQMPSSNWSVYFAVYSNFFLLLLLGCFLYFRFFDVLAPLDVCGFVLYKCFGNLRMKKRNKHQPSTVPSMSFRTFVGNWFRDFRARQHNSLRSWIALFLFPALLAVIVSKMGIGMEVSIHDTIGFTVDRLLLGIVFMLFLAFHNAFSHLFFIGDYPGDAQLLFKRHTPENNCVDVLSSPYTFSNINTLYIVDFLLIEGLKLLLLAGIVYFFSPLISTHVWAFLIVMIVAIVLCTRFRFRLPLLSCARDPTFRIGLPRILSSSHFCLSCVFIDILFIVEYAISRNGSVANFYYLHNILFAFVLIQVFTDRPSLRILNLLCGSLLLLPIIVVEYIDVSYNDAGKFYQTAGVWKEIFYFELRNIAFFGTGLLLCSIDPLIFFAEEKFKKYSHYFVFSEEEEDNAEGDENQHAHNKKPKWRRIFIDPIHSNFHILFLFVLVVLFSCLSKYYVSYLFCGAAYVFLHVIHFKHNGKKDEFFANENGENDDILEHYYAFNCEQFCNIFFGLCLCPLYFCVKVFVDCFWSMCAFHYDDSSLTHLLFYSLYCCVLFGVAYSWLSLCVFKKLTLPGNADGLRDIWRFIYCGFFCDGEWQTGDDISGSFCSCSEDGKVLFVKIYSVVVYNIDLDEGFFRVIAFNKLFFLCLRFAFTLVMMGFCLFPSLTFFALDIDTSSLSSLTYQWAVVVRFILGGCVLVFIPTSNILWRVFRKELSTSPAFSELDTLHGFSMSIVFMLFSPLLTMKPGVSWIYTVIVLLSYLFSTKTGTPFWINKSDPKEKRNLHVFRFSFFIPVLTLLIVQIVGYWRRDSEYLDGAFHNVVLVILFVEILVAPQSHKPLFFLVSSIFLFLFSVFVYLFRFMCFGNPTCHITEYYTLFEENTAWGTRVVYFIVQDCKFILYVLLGTFVAMSMELVTTKTFPFISVRPSFAYGNHHSIIANLIGIFLLSTLSSIFYIFYVFLFLIGVFFFIYLQLTKSEETQPSERDEEVDKGDEEKDDETAQEREESTDAKGESVTEEDVDGEKEAEDSSIEETTIASEDVDEESEEDNDERVIASVAVEGETESVNEVGEGEVELGTEGSDEASEDSSHANNEEGQHDLDSDGSKDDLRAKSNDDEVEVVRLLQKRGDKSFSTAYIWFCLPLFCIRCVVDIVFSSIVYFSTGNLSSGVLMVSYLLVGVTMSFLYSSFPYFCALVGCSGGSRRNLAKRGKVLQSFTSFIDDIMLFRYRRGDVRDIDDDDSCWTNRQNLRYISHVFQSVMMVLLLAFVVLFRIFSKNSAVNLYALIGVSSLGGVVFASYAITQILCFLRGIVFLHNRDSSSRQVIGIGFEALVLKSVILFSLCFAFLFTESSLWNYENLEWIRPVSILAIILFAHLLSIIGRLGDKSLSVVVTNVATFATLAAAAFVSYFSFGEDWRHLFDILLFVMAVLEVNASYKKYRTIVFFASVVLIALPLTITEIVGFHNDPNYTLFENHFKISRTRWVFFIDAKLIVYVLLCTLPYFCCFFKSCCRVGKWNVVDNAKRHFAREGKMPWWEYCAFSVSLGVLAVISSPAYVLWGFCVVYWFFLSFLTSSASLGIEKQVMIPLSMFVFLRFLLEIIFASVFANTSLSSIYLCSLAATYYLFVLLISFKRIGRRFGFIQGTDGSAVFLHWIGCISLSVHKILSPFPISFLLFMNFRFGFVFSLALWIFSTLASIFLPYQYHSSESLSFIILSPISLMGCLFFSPLVPDFTDVILIIVSVYSLCLAVLSASGIFESCFLGAYNFVIAQIPKVTKINEARFRRAFREYFIFLALLTGFVACWLNGSANHIISYSLFLTVVVCLKGILLESGFARIFTTVESLLFLSIHYFHFIVLGEEHALKFFSFPVILIIFLLWFAVTFGYIETIFISNDISSSKKDDGELEKVWFERLFSRTRELFWKLVPMRLFVHCGAFVLFCLPYFLLFHSKLYGLLIVFTALFVPWTVFILGSHYTLFLFPPCAILVFGLMQYDVVGNISKFWFFPFAIFHPIWLYFTVFFLFAYSGLLWVMSSMKSKLLLWRLLLRNRVTLQVMKAISTIWEYSTVYLFNTSRIVECCRKKDADSEERSPQQEDHKKNELFSFLRGSGEPVIPMKETAKSLFAELWYNIKNSQRVSYRNNMTLVFLLLMVLSSMPCGFIGAQFITGCLVLVYVNFTCEVSNLWIFRLLFPIVMSVASGVNNIVYNESYKFLGEFSRLLYFPAFGVPLVFFQIANLALFLVLYKKHFKKGGKIVEESTGAANAVDDLENCGVTCLQLRLLLFSNSDHYEHYPGSMMEQISTMKLLASAENKMNFYGNPFRFFLEEESPKSVASFGSFFIWVQTVVSFSVISIGVLLTSFSIIIPGWNFSTLSFSICCFLFGIAEILLSFIKPSFLESYKIQVLFLRLLYRITGMVRILFGLLSTILIVGFPSTARKEIVLMIVPIVLIISGAYCIFVLVVLVFLIRSYRKARRELIITLLRTANTSRELREVQREEDRAVIVFESEEHRNVGDSDGKNKTSEEESESEAEDAEDGMESSDGKVSDARESTNEEDVYTLSDSQSSDEEKSDVVDNDSNSYSANKPNEAPVVGATYEAGSHERTEGKLNACDDDAAEDELSASGVEESINNSSQSEIIGETEPDELIEIKANETDERESFGVIMDVEELQSIRVSITERIQNMQDSEILMFMDTHWDLVLGTIKKIVEMYPKNETKKSEKGKVSTAILNSQHDMEMVRQQGNGRTASKTFSPMRKRKGEVELIHLKQLILPPKKFDKEALNLLLCFAVYDKARITVSEVVEWMTKCDIHPDETISMKGGRETISLSKKLKNVIDTFPFNRVVKYSFHSKSFFLCDKPFRNSEKALEGIIYRFMNYSGVVNDVMRCCFLRECKASHTILQPEKTAREVYSFVKRFVPSKLLPKFDGTGGKEKFWIINILRFCVIPEDLKIFCPDVTWTTPPFVCKLVKCPKVFGKISKRRGTSSSIHQNQFDLDQWAFETNDSMSETDKTRAVQLFRNTYLTPIHSIYADDLNFDRGNFEI